MFGRDADSAERSAHKGVMPTSAWACKQIWLACPRRRTSVGMAPGETLPLTREMFRPDLAVYDTVYRPAETELIRQASDAGSKVANGLSMLLHQGAKSFEIWTRRKAPLAVMRRALRTAVYGEHA